MLVHAHVLWSKYSTLIVSNNLLNQTLMFSYERNCALLGSVLFVPCSNYALMFFVVQNMNDSYLNDLCHHDQTNPQISFVLLYTGCCSIKYK